MEIELQIMWFKPSTSYIINQTNLFRHLISTNPIHIEFIKELVISRKSSILK